MFALLDLGYAWVVPPNLLCVAPTNPYPRPALKRSVRVDRINVPEDVIQRWIYKRDNRP